jgi:hypothetical protein
MRNARWLVALTRRVFCVGLALSLSGCFDVHQSLHINRDGSGSYAMSIAAHGLAGEALAEKRLDLAGLPPPVITHGDDGVVRQTARVRFASLADLRLPFDVISLRVRGHSFFGLGPAHVELRRTFLLGNARKTVAQLTGQSRRSLAQDLPARLRGNVYIFTITLPGSVLHASALTLGGLQIAPLIAGNFWDGHTVSWRVPVRLLLRGSLLRFNVEFSAYGRFANTESLPSGN